MARRLFRAEVARVEQLLTAASDKDTVIYEMALMGVGETVAGNNAVA
jgi:hypothetical protein